MYSDTITKPPRTALEVFENLPEGTFVQLIKNKLIMSPAPAFNHQEILGFIYAQILNLIIKKALGKAVMSPVDVYFDQENVFQPDIIFVANENLDKIQKNGLHGAPDMVIEILSPKTQRNDLGEKKDIYEKYGVKEYWIVDPETRSVQGFFLKNSQYQQAIKMEGKIASRLLNAEFNF